MVWTSANGPKCPVSPEDRGEIGEPQTSYVAQTVIADFLGDLCDGHSRVGGLERNRTDYKRLRELADILISDLRESGLSLSRPDETGAA